MSLTCFELRWFIHRERVVYAIRYGLHFPHLSGPVLGPTQPPVQWLPGLSRGKERQGREADPSPPSSTVVMKGYSYTSTPPVGRAACTEPQCLYKGDLYLFYLYQEYSDILVKLNSDLQNP